MTQHLLAYIKTGVICSHFSGDRRKITPVMQVLSLRYSFLFFFFLQRARRVMPPDPLAARSFGTGNSPSE